MNGKQHGEARFTNTKGKSKLGLWANGDRVKWLEGKSSMVSNSSMSRFEGKNVSGTVQ